MQSAAKNAGDLIRLVYAKRLMSKVFGGNYVGKTTLTYVNPSDRAIPILVFEP
jgi:hypothetical protein